MSALFKPATGKESSSQKRVRGKSSVIEFTEEYPEANPESALQDITRALAYAGVFDGIS